MSSQNAFPRPKGFRPASQPTNPEHTPQQPSWVNPQTQPGYAQPPENSWPPNDSFQSGYGTEPGYGQGTPQQPDYGHWGELQSGHRNEPAPPGPVDPYAPQFEPYVPPGNGAFGRRQQAPVYGQGQQQQSAPQWPAHGGADPGGLDDGLYSNQGFQSQGQRAHAAAEYGEQPYRGSELSAADWAGQPSDFGHDSYQQGDNLGFAQSEGGELDPAYDEDEAEYEDEEPTRSRRPIIVIAALAGAIIVGGGMAYGYKKLTASGPHGDPPIIKSEAFPARTKPADAGGKVFPYTDTKIMGRLGDGSSSAPTDGSTSSLPPPASSDTSQTASNDAATDDDGGPRKVSTLVVGRDGSIQAPPDSGPPGSQVPGTSLVDVFGQNAHASAQPPPGRDEPSPEAQASKPVSGDDTPAPVKKAAAAPVKIKTLNSTSKPSATSSIDDDGAPAAPSRKPLKRVARAESGTASDAYDPGSGSVASSGGTGYVAVLASIPHSSSSRIDALKRYADMQQKYSSALSGKTPDISSANLGAKGHYDRLVVGPPGSRQEANSVCAELKAAGYSNCWVTSY